MHGQNSTQQSTSSLIDGGMITLYHAVAQGQASNEESIGRSTNATVKTLGTFHILPQELQESLIALTRANVKRTRKFYDDALEQQRAARQRKEDIMMQRMPDQAQEDFIVAIYFYEQ